MNAYDEDLLSKARTNLAFMFDESVNTYNIPLNKMFNAFISSGIARKFERGDIRTIAGSSGTELAYSLFIYLNSDGERKERETNIDKSPEYWLGWVMAYYQWYKNISFEKIAEIDEIDNLLGLYEKYHQMDVKHFVDIMDDKMKIGKRESALKRLRRYALLSQRDLADKTGIPLRTIQQYEQRQKNINHASVDYVISLSKALYCRPEELLEQ